MGEEVAGEELAAKELGEEGAERDEDEVEAEEGCNGDDSGDGAAEVEATDKDDIEYDDSVLSGKKGGTNI